MIVTVGIAVIGSLYIAHLILLPPVEDDSIKWGYFDRRILALYGLGIVLVYFPAATKRLDTLNGRAANARQITVHETAPRLFWCRIPCRLTTCSLRRKLIHASLLISLVAIYIVPRNASESNIVEQIRATVGARTVFFDIPLDDKNKVTSTIYFLADLNPVTCNPEVLTTIWIKRDLEVLRARTEAAATGVRHQSGRQAGADAARDFQKPTRRLPFGMDLSIAEMRIRHPMVSALRPDPVAVTAAKKLAGDRFQQTPLTGTKGHNLT